MRFGLLLVTASMILGHPLAAATEVIPAPVAIDAPAVIVEGYDWSARDHATHLVIDAATPAHTIDLSLLALRWIDLEVRGAAPDVLYYFSTALDGRQDMANARGSAVFWTVPAVADVWVLQEAVTGRVLSTVTMVGAPHALSFQMQMCPRCYEENTTPRSSLFEASRTIVQSAYSFSADSRIRVEECWEHSVTIKAAVNGKIAGQQHAGGGSYTDTAADCLAFSSLGMPRLARQETTFRKDVYADGSWKIYATGMKKVRTVLNEDVWFAPTAFRETVITDDPDHPTISRKESNAGAIWYEYGARAFGVNLGVSFHALASATTEVTIEFIVPPGATRCWDYRYINGDLFDTGIVAAVWGSYDVTEDLQCVR